MQKILENWSEKKQKIRRLISRKRNSASALNGCIEKDMSKVILSLPTDNEVVEMFESTLTD